MRVALGSLNISVVLHAHAIVVSYRIPAHGVTISLSTLLVDGFITYLCPRATTSSARSGIHEYTMSSTAILRSTQN